LNGKPSCVLDASALLCYLQGESGAGEVAEAIVSTAAMGAVNWAEVLSKLADHGLNPDDVTKRLLEQGLLGKALLIHPLDEDAAREIARLRPLTKSAGLSLGDRACLALARRLRLPVLTADSSWGQLKLGIKVLTIR